MSKNIKTQDHPIKLRDDPIVRAIFEFRFATKASGVADLLPGILYGKLGHRFDRVENLPANSIPLEVRRSTNPSNYQYETIRRLVGKNVNLNIGEQAINIEVLKQYPGWKEFSHIIFEVLEAALDSPLILDIERTSLRYQNILNGFSNDLSSIDIEVKLANFEIRDEGLFLRAEVVDKHYFSVVQLSTVAAMQIISDGNNYSVDGPMIDIDTMIFEPRNFKNDYKKIVGNMHTAEKKIFFRLLKPDFVEKLKPIWDKG